MGTKEKHKVNTVKEAQKRNAREMKEMLEYHKKVQEHNYIFKPKPCALAVNRAIQEMKNG